MNTRTIVIVGVVVVAAGVAFLLLSRTLRGGDSSSRDTRPRTQGAKLGAALRETGEAVASIDALF